MIDLRMKAADLARMRFAYSPLAEVAESLWQLASGRVQPVHRGWFEATRPHLHRVDTALLRAVVPARPEVADVLFVGATDPGTSIDSQLRLVADYSPDRLRADLESVWHGAAMPAAARALVDEGAAGARRLADALWQYWTVAIEPHWRQIRTVLDDDVAYRATRLTCGGVDALLSDLHPDLKVHGEALQIDRKRHAEHELSGTGLLLVPSVFAWPNIVVDTSPHRPPSLTYASRGVGKLWGTDPQSTTDDDSLAALLGRSRAAILLELALPQATTELAVELGQSPPAVSQHLSVLRRSGLVVSWRSGRRVLYRRTPLGTSIVEASGATADRRSERTA